MPRVIFTGPTRAHAPSLPAFEPGEERDVSDEVAERLLRNVHFGLVETEATPEPAADEKPSRKSKALAAPEGTE